MESIVLIGLLLFVAAIVTPILAFLAFQKANQLEDQVRLLQLEIAKLKEDDATPKAPAPLINPIEPKEQPSAAFVNDLPAKPEPTSVTVKVSKPAPVMKRTQSAPPTAPASQWLDKCLAHIQNNWLVWTGGLALVIGAGYLVQVVGSNFTFPPMVRVLTAAIFSLLFIAAGEFSHRKISAISRSFLSEKADAYIPAALYSSGMSGLYATIVFSTVIYQIFTPSLALIAMAILALACLTLTQRLGPLMAALGLFGGYSAPIWIDGSDPNYLLLTCYIVTISLAGLATYARSKIAWLPLSITIAHCAWLLLIAFTLPDEQLLLWYLAFVPLSTYLLVFVPFMGPWLQLRYQQPSHWKLSRPIISALGLTLINFAYLEHSQYSDIEPLWFMLWPTLLLVLPVIRQRFSPRSYDPVTILAIICIQIAAIVTNEIASNTTLWGIVAVLTLIAALRTAGQYAFDDRNKIAYWTAFATLPSLLITNLLYLDLSQSNLTSIWAIFAVASSAGALVIANRTRQLIEEFSITMHLVVLTICYCFLSNEWLALTISLQVLIAIIQHTRKMYSPGQVAIKIMMAALIFFVSATPFSTELQIKFLSPWSWVLASYIPILGLLIAAHRVLQRESHALTEWMSGAILHIVVMLVFAQTNYWLRGSFNFILNFDFYSVSLFVCQSIALFAVYQYKLKLSANLEKLYRYYSLGLLSIAAVLFIALNSLYQPLLNSYITGADLPVLNWLAVGWLIPALLLLAITKFKLYSRPLKHLYINSCAAIAFALWLIYSIRQFWQQGSLSLTQPTSMAETFTYSVTLILVGAAATYFGVRRKDELIQKAGLITLGVAVCKVFLLDTAALEGIWRAVSFLGLGGSLIALGWLFQRLHYRTERQAADNV